MNSLDKLLKNGTKTFQLVFEQEFNKVVRSELVPDIKRVLLGAYDELAGFIHVFGGEVSEEDPLDLKSWRGLFEDQITEELSKARYSNGELFLEVLNKEKLGYGGQAENAEGPPSSVDWLVYYIEGVAGEFAFISEELYKVMRGELGEKRFNRYGRLGKGFLIPKDKYIREGWEKRTGVPFQKVKHPISGAPPFRGFEDALERLDFNKYIAKAIEQTNKIMRDANLQ